MEQLLLDLLPPPAACFDNFVHGRNGEAVAALQSWLVDSRAPTCFLLWGDRHSGRGHLVRAAERVLAGVSALPALPEFPVMAGSESRPFSCKLCVDALDEAGQAELFNAFNRLRIEGGRLLVTSTQPPAAMTLREDLRTRLASGLVYRLHALSDEEKRAALVDRAAARGMSLPDGVVDYLFRHGERDLGHLMALLDALDRFSLRHQRPLTLPLLKQLLQAA